MEARETQDRTLGHLHLVPYARENDDNCECPLLELLFREEEEGLRDNSFDELRTDALQKASKFVEIL